ncbi:hypothetical protein FREDWARD_103 [Mycobacterium phage Fredward]|uniref:hypothetical protein n=1 Tax=Mycobacterium phage Fredward TaxID=1354510 RepID=UPI0003BA0656|nr:hypothetical protein V424_gp005 [Mycobacterium phage Fredward]AGY37050.1 hypothetical protein FREDWARD_103 [Mycobacterium phage Fredward]
MAWCKMVSPQQPGGTGARTVRVVLHNSTVGLEVRSDQRVPYQVRSGSPYASGLTST